MIVFVVFVSFPTMKSLFFISKSRLLKGSKESQFYSLPFGQAVACMTSPKAISSGELARRLVVIFRRPMQQREGRGFQPELICDFFYVDRSQVKAFAPRGGRSQIHQASFTNIWIIIFQHIDSVMDKIEGGYRMECPDGCPQRVYSVMRECWEIDPKQRPSFKKIYSELDQIYRSFLPVGQLIIQQVEYHCCNC